MTESLVFACACPRCSATTIVAAADMSKPLTPLCHCHNQNATIDSPFAYREWESCSTPRLLGECNRSLSLIPTTRKLRLLHVAVCRSAYSWCKNYWFGEAVAACERFAEGKPDEPLAADIREHLAPYRRGHKHWTRTDWVAVGLSCVAETPQYPPDGTDPNLFGLIADTYRELFPNPFGPLTWKPDWLTATVRDLAQHIYATHEFSAMPILADALQDAGCDSEYILSHCRANKPHARGCWVLDAILGKS